MTSRRTLFWYEGAKGRSARVSTYNRAQDISIEGQQKQLWDAGCDRVITVRESGFKGPRKGWHELRRLVASGTVKEVIWSLINHGWRVMALIVEFLEKCAIQGNNSQSPDRWRH